MWLLPVIGLAAGFLMLYFGNKTHRESLRYMDELYQESIQSSDEI